MFEPGHSEDDGMIANRCDKKCILLRDIGDVITKCDLMSHMNAHPAISKGNLSSLTWRYFQG